jgi:hypothetical protein
MTDEFTNLPAESRQKQKKKHPAGPGRPKGSSNGDTSYKVTEEHRHQVMVGAAHGIRQDELCKIIGISPVTLRKYYPDELKFGKTMANAKVGGALFSKAMEGNVTAQIFWLKSQAGYREADRLELTGANGKQLVNLTETDKEQRMLAVLQKAFKKEAKTIDIGPESRAN